MFEYDHTPARGRQHGSASPGYADLDGAILLRADLTDAELCDVSLRGVIADNTTTWPAGFTPPRHGLMPPQPGPETRGRHDPQA